MIRPLLGSSARRRRRRRRTRPRRKIIHGKRIIDSPAASSHEYQCTDCPGIFSRFSRRHVGGSVALCRLYKSHKNGPEALFFLSFFPPALQRALGPSTFHSSSSLWLGVLCVDPFLVFFRSPSRPRRFPAASRAENGGVFCIVAPLLDKVVCRLGTLMDARCVGIGRRRSGLHVPMVCDQIETAERAFELSSWTTKTRISLPPCERVRQGAL